MQNGHIPTYEDIVEHIEEAELTINEMNMIISKLQSKILELSIPKKVAS